MRGVGLDTEADLVSEPVDVDSEQFGVDIEKGDMYNVTSNLGNTFDITPSHEHAVSEESHMRGKPNSSADILGRDGTFLTRRWYGPDGNAFRDVDMTDHKNPARHPEVPHEHYRVMIDGVLRRK